LTSISDPYFTIPFLKISVIYGSNAGNVKVILELKKQDHLSLNIKDKLMCLSLFGFKKKESHSRWL